MQDIQIESIILAVKKKTNNTLRQQRVKFILAIW